MENNLIEYNGKSIKIGSIAEMHDVIRQHIMAHFDYLQVLESEQTDSNRTIWMPKQKS